MSSHHVGLCAKMWLILLCVSCPCASFLTQVKCFTPMTAQQAMAWWACSWLHMCGSAMPCWSPWNTTLRSSPSTFLSSPHTPYGETCTASTALLWLWVRSTGAKQGRSRKIHISLHEVSSIWIIYVALKNSFPRIQSCLFWTTLML